MRILLHLVLFLCCISVAQADPSAILDLPRLEENYSLTYRVESSPDGVRWGARHRLGPLARRISRHPVPCH